LSASAIQPQQRIKPAKTIHPYDLFSPMVSNSWVQKWIHFFQHKQPNRFRTWLERSYRYVPMMQRIFQQVGLPQDLVYMAMIESGFSAKAISPAKAVGYWQFISETGQRFGLRQTSWLDERRDFEKSTIAASRYLKFLYKKFGNWYLTIAAYNMGEQRLARLIKKYQTTNFWHLCRKSDFPHETAHYVPQLIASITIARAPALYGFHYLKVHMPHEYEVFYIPGGTNLQALAKHINYPYRAIKNLNPALLTDYIPSNLDNWRMRIPMGTGPTISHFIQVTTL